MFAWLARRFLTLTLSAHDRTEDIVATVASPVTPAVVGWAVSEDGRSLAELAEAVGVKVDTLDGWVTGDAAPTRGQVTRLATSTRPGTATISCTVRDPSGSVARCTTMSMHPATVGTTNRLPMFSPASNGRVHILVIASRAEFA